MDAKIRATVGGFDKLCDILPTSDLSPEVSAELVRLREQRQYLRSDAYHLRLKLFSTLWATAAGIIIMFGVDGLCYAAGISPAKLFRGFYMGVAAVAFFLVRSLWEIKKEKNVIARAAHHDTHE